MKLMIKNIGALMWLMALWLTLLAQPIQARAVEFDSQVKKPVTDAIHIRQTTQKEEAQWREDQRILLAQYEQLEVKLQQLEERREKLTSKNSAAQSRIEDKQQQLVHIEEMQATIIPMVEEQIESLDRHIDGDLPYFTAERRARLERLEQVYADPEVAVSEKFRKVMEALLIEAEYGHTIEVYQQTIAAEGRDMLVNIFRLGRIALYYQTLDQKTCGFYNVATASWQSLPAQYNRAVQTAMDIGAKRRPAEMLTLPLGRMRIP